MPGSGTCAKTLELRGDIVKYSWMLTGDAGGDADGVDLGTDSTFFHQSIFGQPVGARVINSDCSAAYDITLLDGDVDIFDSELTNLSVADGIENFALPMFEHSTASAIIRGPIYLWNRTLEAKGTAMGGTNSCIVELYVAKDPIIGI